MMQIYVEATSATRFFLSDDGYTIADLEMSAAVACGSP